MRFQHILRFVRSLYVAVPWRGGERYANKQQTSSSAFLRQHYLLSSSQIGVSECKRLGRSPVVPAACAANWHVLLARCYSKQDLHARTKERINAHQHADVIRVEVGADTDCTNATGAEASGHGSARHHPLPGEAAGLGLKSPAGAACVHGTGLP